MSRRIEGTTMGGFKCDSVGCDQNGTHAPMVCVPYEGYPVEIRNPLIAFLDTHCCRTHFNQLKGYDVLFKAVRDQIEMVARENGGRPAFKRAYVKPVRTQSPEYLNFQRASGLIPPDDAKASGSIIIPNLR